MRHLNRITLLIIVINSLAATAQRPGNCLWFDGTGGCVLAPSTPVTQPSEQITVDLWVKYDEISPFSTPFSTSEDNHAEESGYAFAIYNSKLVFFLKIEGSSGEDWYFNPGASIEAGQWYHVAGTYDGNEIRMYLNGELKGIRPHKGSISWDYKPDHLSIGAFKDKNEQNPFKGSIDEVHVWSKALPENEVKKLLNTKITGKEKNLLICYDFDEEGGDVVIEKAHGVDAEFVNMKPDCRRKSFAMYRPANVKYTRNRNNSLTFQWKWEDDVIVDKFIIDLYTDEDCTQPVAGLRNIEVVDSETFTTPDLGRGADYYFRVRAFNKLMGVSCNSEILKINDLSAAINLSLNLDQKNVQLIKAGKIINNSIRISPTNSVVKLTFSQNQSSVERADSIRFRIPGVFSKWTVVKTKNISYHYLNLPFGRYKLQVQYPDKRGHWSQIDHELRISKSHSIWFYIFVFSGLMLLTIIVVYYKKRYKLVIQLQSVLTAEQTQLLHQIRDCLEVEKCFLQPDFDLGALSLRVHRSKDIVSNLVTKHYKRDANDIINYLRVEEVKKQLKNPVNKNFTVCSIAFNCGFSAESSFYRIFKKETGLTPTQYLEKSK